jgi:epoxyqueuosine reductase
MTPDASHIKQLARNHGADLVGITDAGAIPDATADSYRRWIADGCHASMHYLDRYHDVRDDARLLLDGARSLIVCLFNYRTICGARPSDRPLVAEYALGRDYHEVVRQRLWALAAELAATYGGEYRPCVDTAPLRERYWAARAGLGFIGRNCQLTVPGRGSHFFIGTLVTTLDIDSDTPLTADYCGTCRRCVDACPGHAIDGKGHLDARRCLSYLTIESRDPLPEGTDIGMHLYGCDDCRLACPHERDNDLTDIAEFAPNPTLTAMTANDWQDITPGEYRRLTRHSAMSRASLAKILSTLQTLLKTR